MAGIVIQLAVSWLLLWFVCKKHLSVLGFRPTKERAMQFGIGLLLAAACCALYQVLTTAFINNGWVANTKATTKTILEGVRYNIISVLFEELIFRAALLYIAIRKLGVTKACILSGIAFGIYHWFSFNVFGNPFMMMIVFVMTAFVGVAWAFAFAKTGSVYLPIALHLGWNIVSTVVFTNASGGQGVFVKANEHQLQGIPSLLVFLFQVFALPLLTFWYLRWLSGKQRVVDEQQKEPGILQQQDA